jgi:WD40 repeat protein
MSAAVYHVASGKKIGPFVEEKNIFSERNLEAARVIRWNADPGSLCVSTDGRHLVTGSADGIINVWDVMEGHIKVSLKGHASAIVCVELSPHGTHLLSASQDGTVIYWDLKREISVIELSIGGSAPAASSMSFSPDGKLFAAAASDNDDGGGNFVMIWNTDGHLVSLLETNCRREYVEFSPTGNQLFAGTSSTADLWERDSQVEKNGGWQSKASIHRWFETWHAVAWRPDGPWAISQGFDGCGAWDIMSDQHLFHLEVPSHRRGIAYI